MIEWLASIQSAEQRLRLDDSHTGRGTWKARVHTAGHCACGGAASTWPPHEFRIGSDTHVAAELVLEVLHRHVARAVRVASVPVGPRLSGRPAQALSPCLVGNVGCTHVAVGARRPDAVQHELRIFALEIEGGVCCTLRSQLG